MSQKIPYFSPQLSRMEMRELLNWGRHRLHALKTSKHSPDDAYTHASDTEFATKLYVKLMELACTDSGWKEIQKERQMQSKGLQPASLPPGN